MKKKNKRVKKESQTPLQSKGGGLFYIITLAFNFHSGCFITLRNHITLIIIKLISHTIRPTIVF